MPRVSVETITGLEIKARSPKAVAGTFRDIFREIGAPVEGKISVNHILNDFESIAGYAKDPDTLRSINTALNSCFGVIAKPPSEREDLATHLHPLERLQDHIQNTHKSKPATLQLVIDTVTALSHKPGADSILKAQVAFLAFAQTLGEFGIALPQPLGSGEALLEELIKLNDEAAKIGRREQGKLIPGAKEIHEKLSGTDQIYGIVANQTSAGAACLTEDRRAIEVSVPTTTSPYAEGIIETGSLAYRIHFVTQAQFGQWEAATMHEPIKTTEFNPEIHTLTQTLGFWPELPSDSVRYGLVVEQIGDWKVTQEKKAGIGKTSTAFANQADEREFLKVLEELPIVMRSLFYESMSNPDILTPFTDRLGKLLAVLKEKGYEDLLKAPMYTAGRYKTDRISYAAAFCGRVGDQNSPGNLIPLGIHLDARAHVGGELMYTPDSLSEMVELKYSDLNERRQILESLGLDKSPENKFEFFIHTSTVISGVPPKLDGTQGGGQFTRDLFTRPYTHEESEGVGSDSTMNLVEILPVVTEKVTEGEKTDPTKELDTLGKLLAYYAVLDQTKQESILWNCPQVSRRLKELDEEQDRLRDRVPESLLLSGPFPSSRGLSFGVKYGVSGTVLDESKYAGRATIRSSVGVSAQLDPIHIRLIVQY